MKIKNKYISLLFRVDSKLEENLDFDQETETQQYGQDSIKISPSKDSRTVASLFSNRDITKRISEQFNQDPTLRQVKSISTDMQPLFFAIDTSNTGCQKLTQKSPLLQKPLIIQQIPRIQLPSERFLLQLPNERGYSDRSIYSMPNEKGLPALILSPLEPNKLITTKTLDSNRSWKRHRHLKQCSVPQLDKRVHPPILIPIFLQIWKEDAVLEVLRARLILNNKNEVQSLRSIFLVQLHGISVLVTHFYIPKYKRIINQFGLQKDWSQWVGTVSEVLRITEMYFYFLDGSPIESLFGIPNHENMIYLTTQRIFNFWSIIKQNQKMENEFQVSKYSELLTTLHDLKTKEDIIKFFTHKQSLQLFFSKECAKKNDVIDMEGLRNQDFGRGMLGLDKTTARVITEAIQQLMNLEVPQYKCRINAQQLDSRYRNIDNLRKKIRPILTIPLDQPTTNDLIGRGDQAIHQISNEAFQKVSRILKFPAPKKVPPRQAVSNPFELLNFKSLDRFASILTSVNLEYIMNEKQMSRVDLINYLVVFKCLMDSDSMPFSDKLLFFDGTNMDLFQVSKVHILRSLPYIVLYKNSLNVAELNVQTSGQGYLKFYDFLDIFNES